jgi:hypothetical protein
MFLDEALNDTSFMIAIQQLRLVKSGLALRRCTPTVRCLFVEKSQTAFGANRGQLTRTPKPDLFTPSRLVE